MLSNKYTSYYLSQKNLRNSFDQKKFNFSINEFFMKGKIIFISGSTDGIGKQAAVELAARGAHIIVHG